MAQAFQSRAILLYKFVSVDRLMDLSRFRFVDCKNIYQILHVFLWIGAPANDIDLFVVKLTDNVFDARPAHADARPYWVHFFIGAPDGDLRAITSFSRDAANLHGAIGNFARFQFEQPAHEIGMTAGDDDLGPADAVFDCDHVRAETIADIVILHDYALALRHDRFKFAQVEDDVRPVETTRGSTDDLARPLLKLLVNHFLFGLPNALHP